MAVNWTKLWAGSDDGTLVGGIDLRNIQLDLASVIQTSDIGSAVQAHSEALDAISTPELINPANLVKNGAMDAFTGSSPDNWTVEGGGTEAQETTEVQFGSNSYSITSDADGSASRQNVLATIGDNDNTYFRDKQVTLTVMVYTDEVDNARIQIDDGSGASYSIYHTGTLGWEQLSVTHTIAGTATKLDVVLLVDGNAVEAKFDAVRLNHGSVKLEFAHHRSDA